MPKTDRRLYAENSVAPLRRKMTQLMNRRYETASTVLTSNKGFEERGEVLGDSVQFSPATNVQFSSGVDNAYVTKDELAQYARENGLLLELLPWSWYSPEGATAGVFTVPKAEFEAFNRHPGGLLRNRKG